MENIALIIVDWQKGFDDHAYWGGNRNNPEAEQNSRNLLDTWRKLSLPVFHVRHDSTNPASRLAPGQPGNEIKDVVKPLPGEPVIPKNVNSAFIGTDLKQRLDGQGIRTVVIIGIQTDHCVSTTARMAGNFGYNTYVVSDATATFDRIAPNGEKLSSEMIHQINLTSLSNEFATVITTEALLKKINQHESLTIG
jgi:nicotinamidase-related amidase